ncbi:hypothetical protein AB6A40_001353 [Gnathostoma spinigerum]|uniref:Nascent polypeptide-associated complex subunit alpha-like UBA domain-containing protein n=1 Tax=Gnathostoma spinigerum TaxID=75299 RepID=A0ABD6EBC0_9BILA
MMKREGKKPFRANTIVLLQTSKSYLFHVTDYHEDNDDRKEVSNEKLGSLINGPRKKKKVVNVRKEDIQMIVDELELPRIRAEKKLIEHNGDVIAATKDLLGF